MNNEIINFCLSLCPDNMEPDMCEKYISTAFDTPVDALNTVDNLCLIWQASFVKKRLADHHPHYKNNSDEDWLNYVEDYSGALPMEVEKKLIQFLENYRTVLLKNSADYKMPLRYDSENYPTLDSKTIETVMDIVVNESLEYIHYVGLCDLSLLKSLQNIKSTKLTMMDYFNRYDSRGYAFDDEMNLYLNEAPEFINEITNYQEGGPHIIDALIMDRPIWGDNTDYILTNDMSPSRPRRFILIEAGRENLQHHYYDWQTIGPVVYGKVKDEHILYTPENDPELVKMDQHMRGEN